MEADENQEHLLIELVQWIDTLKHNEIRSLIIYSKRSEIQKGKAVKDEKVCCENHWELSILKLLKDFQKLGKVQIN